ncbi:MAG: hypothetical protein HQ500_09820 [Flavobacteriales bacterium]|nr:hypothetical protein [Flavobacteriales bacterium]
MKVSKLIARSLASSMGLGSSEQLLGRSGYRVLGLVLKSLISLAVILFIYHRFVSAEQQLSVLAFLSGIQLNGGAVALSLAAALFMVLNWSMEVIKWKYLVSSQFDLPWKRAAKGVLSGITFGLFTPNRVGEFFGRVLTLGAGQRVKGALLSMVNGIAQTVATLTFGVLGILLFLYRFGPESLGWIPTIILQSTVLLTLGLAMILYYRIDLFTEFLLRIPRLGKYSEQIQVFASLSNDLLSKIYFLSIVRFATFIVQYLIVFRALMPGQGMLEVLSASILTLFSITLLPFVPVPDLLLRESFALGYFELYQFDPIGVSIVVFVVWGINVALPSVIGAITLFTFRFFKTKE